MSPSTEALSRLDWLSTDSTEVTRCEARHGSGTHSTACLGQSASIRRPPYKCHRVYSLRGFAFSATEVLKASGKSRTCLDLFTKQVHDRSATLANSSQFVILIALPQGQYPWADPGVH